MEQSKAVKAIEHELARAQGRFEAFHSPHEGCAVIREEFEELWESTKRLKSPYVETEIDELRAEAVQVGAMALRFLVDIC